MGTMIGSVIALASVCHPIRRKRKQAAYPLTHPDPVQSRMAVPDAALLALLGSRDESLRTAEDLLDADVHVRGNELTLTGKPADVAFAERVFTELITLAERGQQVSADAVRRTVEMLGSGRRPGWGSRPPRCCRSTSCRAAAAPSGPRR